MPGTLALVVAHPDDDAYGVAGTVALHADAPGFRFVLIHATDGAAGEIARGIPATPETLGVIRRREDARAWRALGREPDRHVWLDYDDGRLDEAPFDELVDRIAVVFAQEQPDVVATFGPDGMTGHPDHIRIGAATDAAFLRFAGQELGFRRLVHGAMPQSLFDRWNASRRRRGLPEWEPTEVYQLRGVPDDQIGISVDVSAVADRIVAGLREHRSQAHVLGGQDIDDADWARPLGREHYVIVWPSAPPVAGLADLFEGL